MRWMLCLVLCGSVLTAAPKPDDKPKEKPKEKMKDEVAILGSWKTVQVDLGVDGKLDAAELENGGKSRFIFKADNHFELKSREKVPVGTFKLGKDGDLKTLDITFAGRDLLALYELDGDVLKLCYQQRPNSKRPKVFAPDAKNYFAIFIMERQKDEQPKPAPTEFFNGKDLTGWVNLNCGPKTWKVEKGALITSGTPYGLLRSDKQYENFEIEFEWMHINTKEVGNSGFFVWCDGLPQVGGPYTRGIEVQVLVNYPDVGWATNQGDVYSVSGAKCKPDRPHPKGYERCLPSENRCKGGGEWNTYKVIANDGVIKLHVNGKEVSGVSGCTPRKGYLAFESEGAECHFKNIKFKELPSTNPKKEETAIDDRGFRPIFNHTDLTGWSMSGETWTVKNGTMVCTGNGGLKYKLPGKKTEMLFDWKGPDKMSLLETAGTAVRPWPVEAKKPGIWERSRVALDASDSIEFNFADKLEIKNIYLRELPEEKKK